MRRLVALLPLVVLAALAVLFFGHGLNRKQEVTTKALVGKAMPEMTLPRLDDNMPASLRETVGALSVGPDGRHRPVLVNFYGSYCVPCIEENKDLLALKAAGVPIIGVSWKDEPADTKAFLARYGDPFAARLVDQADRLGFEFGVAGPPETYLIGANGVILDKHISVLTLDDAKAMLAEDRS